MLNLDARQRAMLQEMGITVWAPAPPAPQPRPAAPAAVQAPAHVAAAPRVQAPPPATSAPPAKAPAAPSPAPAPAGTGYALGPARPAYPQAPPGAPGATWLVVAECAQPDDPFAGDAGRLLDNMLRALRLHHNPRVFIAPLVRGDGDAGGGDLATALGQTQAALVLALGLPAARTVLGRSEPLGRLRASPQAVDGTPVAVTYDPAYLLRAPQAKASAWADLCHAAALVAVR